MATKTQKIDKATKLLRLEHQYNSIAKVIDFSNEYGKPYEKKKIAERNWIRNPFQSYDLEKGVQEIRHNILRDVVRILTEDIPNVDIDEEKINKELTERKGEYGFSVLIINEIINRDYVSKAEELSRKEIFKLAKNLLPNLWGTDFNRKETELKDILDGKKLKLEVSIRDFAFRGEHDYSFNESRDVISAFDKVCGLVANSKATIVKIADSVLTQKIVYDSKPFDYDIIINDRNIEKVRIYKNGKFIVVFDNEENAKKVSEKLLEKIGD